MRKILLVFMSIFILTLGVHNSYSQVGALSGDSSPDDYTPVNFDIQINGELLTTDVSPIVINGRTLVPVRAIFEKLGAVVEWFGSEKKVHITLDNNIVVLRINDDKAFVNGAEVEMEIPARIINSRTLVPIRFVGEQLNMEVGWIADKKLITLDSTTEVSAFGSLNSIDYLTQGYQDKIIMTFDTYHDYTTMRLTEPDRIVIDITDAVAPGKQQIIDVNSHHLESIRYAQFDTETVRVVLDVKNHPEFLIEQNDNVITVYLSSNTLANRGEDVREEPPIDNEVSVQYNSRGIKDEIVIHADNYKDYNVFRLTSPERIVVDIPNATVQLKQQTIDVSSHLVESVRYAQFDKNTVRIVVDLTEQLQYNVLEEDGQLVIEVQNPTYKNIKYHSNGDRIYFTLAGAKLTEGGEDLERFYSGEYDKTGKKYIIKFSSKLAELGTGKITINDSLLESIEIIEDKNTLETSIVFNGKDKFQYLVYYRTNTDDTAITILKPASAGEKIIVIDAGHGGVEPGAIHQGLSEKELNLDIATRLNCLLTANNVNTYMIREDDSFVALYERTYIANILNASLFLSIHNNAYYSSHNGSETLYFPSGTSIAGLNGKSFAGIIQNSLVTSLNTFNRGIKNRPNLVVLRATAMPAALTEIAFMTNAEDMKNLKSPTFRQKAAQALYDGIIKAIGELK